MLIMNTKYVCHDLISRSVNFHYIQEEFKKITCKHLQVGGGGGRRRKQIFSWRGPECFDCLLRYMEQ